MGNNTLEIILRLRDELSGELKKAIGSFDNAKKSIQETGEGLIKLGAAPTAALILASKTAIDFESAFAGIRKTVDASEAEFKQLESNIRNISKSAPVSAVELSRIGELAGQLGVRGVENLSKFMDVISKISVTTNLTSEGAATSFARIANVMQLPIDNVDKMAASVVALGNNFATTEQEIVGFAERIAGAGKIAGFSTNDIFGIAAAMSSVGVEAEAGGTAVQKMMLEMNNSVATSNDKLQVFAETSGMTAAEFKKAWEEEANGAFSQFVMGLGKQGDEAVQTLEKLELTDVRLSRAFLSLANAGDLVTQAARTSNTAWRENTALTEEAEKRYNTTASQLQIFKNNLIDIGITIGSVILPALNSFLTSIQPIINGFAEFAANHPTLITGILAIGAGLGALGVVMTLISTVIIPAISAAITVLGAVLGFLLSPIGLIIAGLTLLFVAWQSNFLGIQTIVTNFVNQAVLILTQLWNTITSIFNAIYTVVSTIINAIWSVVSYVLTQIKTFFEFIFLAIKAAVEIAMAVMLVLIDMALQRMFGVSVAQLSAMYNTFQDKFNLIKSVVTTLVNQAADWFKGRLEAMSSHVSSITGAILGKFQSMASGIMSALRSIKFPRLSIGTGSVNVGGQEIQYPKLNVDWYEKGGFVKNTGLAMVHEGEYVLSKDMLQGRAPIDQSVHSNRSTGITINAVINNPLDFDAVVDKLTWRMNYSY